MFRLSHLLLNPKKASRHPLEMLLVGFFYASLSLLLSLWIFPGHASLTMVFLTIISCLYVVQGAIIKEAEKERKLDSEKMLIKHHARTLMFLLFLFIGFLLAFMFWTIVLPGSIVSAVFNMQMSEINNIRAVTGNAISNNGFNLILENNMKVLCISLLFAIFYGAGAIFILAWNASVMGFVMGELVRNTLGFASLPLVFARYFLHGIPEMIAYFIAALSGGIIFITILRSDFSKEKLKRTAIDIFSLITLSLLILIIAAFLEAYVSPLI